MAVHDTVENGRSKYTNQVLDMFMNTVNFRQHRLIIVDNNSCKLTHDFYESLKIEMQENVVGEKLQLIFNSENIGTARAINMGMRSRLPGEAVIKIDNDCVVHQHDWVEQMEEAIRRDPKLGIVGLKRVDLEQHPDHTAGHFKTKLRMLPRKKGDSWLVVEESADITGTCTLFNPALMDAIGYMYQCNGPYGFDDADYAWRSRLAGFTNCFLPHMPISHIDTGEGAEYLAWKQKKAGEKWDEYRRTIQEYQTGTRPLYYDGEKHVQLSS